jgi:hypothetical protein
MTSFEYNKKSWSIDIFVGGLKPPFSTVKNNNNEGGNNSNNTDVECNNHDDSKKSRNKDGNS